MSNHRGASCLPLVCAVIALVALDACGGAPPSPAARILSDQGAEQLARGELEEAEASLRLALEIEPGSAAAHANLGLVALARGELDEAEAQLRGAIHARQDFVEAWSSLGVVLERRGRVEEAEHAYVHALSVNPGRAEPRLCLARLLVRRGRPAEARAHLLRLVALLPGDPEALGLLAWAELRVDRPQAAADLVARALETDPDAAAARFVHALLRARRGELAPARETLEALETDTVLGHEASLRIATIDAVSGELARAQQRITQLLDDDPFDPAVRLVAGVIARDRGELDAALAHAREARTLAPDVAESWLLEAECCALLGDPTCAETALTRVPASTDAMHRERERVRTLMAR